MAVVALYLAIMVTLYNPSTSNNFTRNNFRVIGGCVGVIGAFAGWIIFVGMLVHLFQRDGPSTRRRVLWLVAFFFTACFGSSLYYFVVYRRQVPLGGGG
jgi:hypothetical protein